MLWEAGYYSRMSWAVCRLARMSLEPDPARLVRQTLENREENFLDLMRRAVFENSSNPYRELLRWAGCEYGDLDRAVRRDGLEPTLQSLRREGVYLSHDEFKGKKPVERSGKEILVNPNDFLNPFVKGLWQTVSSGSRSRGTTTAFSLEFERYREAHDYLFLSQFGLPERTVIGMGSTLPSNDGLGKVINLTRRGVRYEKWFALGGTFRQAGHYQLATKLLLLEARMCGAAVPIPIFLRGNDFSPVARWLARRRSEGVPCLLSGGVSRAVRVAAAANELGLDISGTPFVMGAEALTEAKQKIIIAAGCRGYNRYGISELGRVGSACPRMNRAGSVHVARDMMAVISYKRTAPLTQVEIDSLMFTPLLPSTPRVLINVEMDDGGMLGPAKCGCSLEAMGFNQQIESVYSYGKLTGQGRTLVGGDVLRILEEALPERFGGVPSDYQLVEREGENQTEIELRVHPRVRAASAEEVKNFFLSELKQIFGGGPTHSMWTQTDAVRVVIAEPYMSGNKVHALHLLGTAERQRGN